MLPAINFGALSLTSDTLTVTVRLTFSTLFDWTLGFISLAYTYKRKVTSGEGPEMQQAFHWLHFEETNFVGETFVNIDNPYFKINLNY